MTGGESQKNSPALAKEVLHLAEALYVSIKRGSIVAAEKYLKTAKDLNMLSEICVLTPREKERWLRMIDQEDNQYGMYEPIARNKDINLVEAIKRNRLAILQCMGKLGLDFQTCMNNYSMTPLGAAARWGQLEVTSFLIEAGEHLDHKNVLLQTPLYAALQYKHIDLVRLLLEKGANTSLRDAFGQTPVMFFLLHCGCRIESDLDIFRCLLETGATVLFGDAQTGMMPIHAAICKSGIPDKTVQLLIKYTPDINCKCSGGWTALHFVCASSEEVLFKEEIDKKKRCDIANLLLRNGADPNVADEKYETPLHLAARNGFAKVSEILVENGADPTLRDIEGNRAIEYAQPQSGVWYVLRSAIKEKRSSGTSTPNRISPLPQSTSRVFFPDKDDIDGAILSDSHEHVTIGTTTTPFNPRDEAWDDVQNKIDKLENQIRHKDPRVLIQELDLLKQSLNNLKSQEDFIFSKIWPSGYPTTPKDLTLPSNTPKDPCECTEPNDGKSPTRHVFKLTVDLANPEEITNSQQKVNLKEEDLLKEERTFFKACRVASDLLGLEWKMVFRDLEVYDPLQAEIVIKEIEQRCPGQLREQSYQALLDWKKIKGKEATFDGLIETLKECSLINVAQTIQDRLM